MKCMSVSLSETDLRAFDPPKIKSPKPARRKSIQIPERTPKQSRSLTFIRDNPKTKKSSELMMWLNLDSGFQPSPEIRKSFEFDASEYVQLIKQCAPID